MSTNSPSPVEQVSGLPCRHHAGIFSVQRLTAIALLSAAVTLANPVDFGRAELNAALAARNIDPAKLRITAEVATDRPESFRIERNHIFGGDLRGLMYGLLEAADQIRATGKLANTRGQAGMPIRGVRIVVENAAAWGIDDYWAALTRMLARNRFNRLHVLFGEDPSRLNAAKLRFVSQLAADHGIEFTLGLVHTGSALQALLRDCPAVRGVHVLESAATGGLLQAITASGRRVKLDVPAGLAKQGVIQASRAAGVPLQLAGDYPPGTGFTDLLERQPVRLAPEQTTPLPMINGLPKAPLLPRPYEFYWASPTNPTWLAEDPQHVRRALSIFNMSDTQGFEVGAPVAPVFTEANKHHIFWTYDWERYWLFYTLWGRLGYDPSTPERVWMDELRRRFGAAAPDVMRAYGYGSRILEEIAMRDTSHVANFDEAVRNRIDGIASAKQTAVQTAVRLHALAREMLQLLERVRKTFGTATPEWQSSEVDFQMLANVAQFNARKQMAADRLASYEVTGNDTGLYAAGRELRAATAAWKRISALIDGVYAVNPWKEKSPDIASIDERIRTTQHPDIERTSDTLTTYPSMKAEEHWPEEMPRPAISHVAPPVFETGKLLILTLTVAPPNWVRSVRLHYRPVNELEKFRTLEMDARASVRFEIPPENLPAHYDLMYYFELLHDRYGGWFWPDPAVAAPYFVSKVAKQ